MIKGKNIFYFVFPILLVFSKAMYILPKFILKWFWDLSDLFPSIVANGLKYIIALRLAKKIGKNVYFGKNLEVKYFENLEIGDNVSIHKDCYIDAIGGLEIGNDVSIAHNSSILTFEHSWSEMGKPIKYNRLILSPVLIKSDVWIGCGVRILSGITIERRSIIAAGSIVNRDVLNNTLVAGVPAKIIKEI